jgi:uncharacterized glyoxalase superfamily protein PhnB
MNLTPFLLFDGSCAEAMVFYQACVTASPGKIGDIARAALVLTHFEHGYIT